MKKYSSILAAIILSISFASCDWNPTDHGNDHDDKDTIVVDSTDYNDREAAVVTLLSNDEVVEVNDKIIKVASVSSLYTNENGRIDVVELMVSMDGGITYKSVTLTSVNTIYKDENCSIELLEVELSPRMPVNEDIYIITLSIS